MYNLLLPNLCAMCSSLRALRLPTVDLYSAAEPDKMCSTLYCVVAYIAPCVDASRMVLLGSFSPPLAGESFVTYSKAAKLVLADTHIFNWLTCFTFSGEAWVH